ncbi:MAG: TRAP transporter permease [Rhodospirillales bacterium]|nr:TRAP transporter permease [Rhodospirillales bacterium]
MAQETNGAPVASQADLADMIADSDTGGRNPTGVSAKVLWVIPLLWALFQLWYASPLPYIFNIGLFNSTEARSIHLAFAIFLAFLAFPAFKGSPRSYIPVVDWILAFVAAGAAAYIFIAYREIAERPGLPTTADVVFGVVGIVMVLEATRRALGPPLMIVAIIFMIYSFGGAHMPEIIAHQGPSLNKGMSHYYLTTEGIFGVALGVSTSMVFLFVLFGSLLEKAGAGNYFIRVAFALMGHLRGGPAKTAVVSSALTGLVSGSAIANVVTTGTFTIPLMKKVGFSAEKAGAVEVASSTNGQLTPPVMGAVAFLMVEFVGITYTEVITHAALPALISYMALVYIVHLEAVKADMKGIPRRVPTTFMRTVFGFSTTLVGLIVMSAIVYYTLSWTKVTFGDATPWMAAAGMIVIYLALVKYAVRYPELETELAITELPETGPTVKAGLYYLLPVFLLIWCLIVERLSPSLSAFWASVFLLFVLLTQDAVKSFLRGTGETLISGFKQGVVDVLDGLIAGSRNMIGIGVATAAAGIVVGTVTLTPIGQVMGELVEFLSGGYLILMLFWTAVFSLILGMGLPTTANYIVVSSLMAPVIVTIGAENGLIVPLIAAHMFVFYFGILADDTPPVAMAAFAAAAISGGDPIKTGLQGFAYDIRTAILPFLFIFNTELLMIGVDTWYHLLITIVTAITAMMLFAAATQGFFIVKCRIWEIAALLLIAFTLFRPAYWMDQIYPPLIEAPAAQVYEVAESLPDNGLIRVRVVGKDFDGKAIDKIIMLPVGANGEGKDRLANAAGLELREDAGKQVIANVQFGGAADKQGLGELDTGEIANVIMDSNSPAKQWMYMPALVLLFVVVMLQRRRKPLTASA